MHAITVILIFSGGLINLRAVSAQITGINANKLIDVAILTVRSKTRATLEPIPLPDQKNVFPINIGPINVTGEIDATNGTLYGLSSLDRIGNSTFQVNGQNTTALVNLGTQNLTFIYDVNITILNIPATTAHIVGTIQNITINSVLGIDAFGYLSLKQFAVQQFKNIVVAIQAKGISDALASALTEVFIALAKDRVKAELTQILETTIAPMFQQIH